MTADGRAEELVDDYLNAGLAIGRHIEGFVDAYYGPPELAAQARTEPAVSPAELADRTRRLLADLAADTELDPARRQWLAAQVRGLNTTCRRLAGEAIGYVDEIEACYGVRPSVLPEEEIAAAHKRLEAVLPGTGPLPERYVAWREAHAIPNDDLETAVASLVEDFRDRTGAAFGLPDGERVDFDLVRDRPWAGFNYYLGGLRSRVAINLDLPVLSLALGHLIAHEAYPGHHTEHCRKEVGLVRRRHQREETIFLVGTPQCLIAEGLADLGIEVILGSHPEATLAEHFRPLGIRYDADVVAEVSAASEVLGSVRGNAAIMIHDHGRSVDEGVAYVERWGLMSHARAAKAVEFCMDPTWRAYPFCYIDGLRVCRAYVAGDPERFERLIADQLTPSQLVAAAAGP